MAITAEVNTSRTIRLNALRRLATGERITSLGAGDSITVEVVDEADETVLDTLAATIDPDPQRAARGDWLIEVTTPLTPADLRFDIAVVIDGRRETFHGYLEVVAAPGS